MVLAALVSDTINGKEGRAREGVHSGMRIRETFSMRSEGDHGSLRQERIRSPHGLLFFHCTITEICR